MNILPVVLVGSGALLLLTGSPTSGLEFMVLVKVGFDIAAHAREPAAA